MGVEIFLNETLVSEASGAVTVCVVLDSETERPLEFFITPIEDGNAIGVYRN